MFKMVEMSLDINSFFELKIVFKDILVGIGLLIFDYFICWF